MTQATSRRHSIYVQLIKLLIGAAAASLLIFFFLNFIGYFLIDHYCYSQDYIRKKDLYYIEKLQRHINENQLHSRDADRLYSWVRKQKVVSIQVYKDGIQVFDAEYPDQELWDEDIAVNEYAWENLYTVTFTDGEAQVRLSGMYAYQFYNFAMVAELVFSFLLFLLFVLLGIRAKMNYILLLSNEIELLEGGSLNYKITVKGNDELAALARGLDSMRISFRSLIDKETNLLLENQKVVTEMSHDLRTPVTSILLYTEILKKGHYKDETQLKEYVEKIDTKTRRLKQLIDHLFEYSLVTGDTTVSLEEPESLPLLFYDLLSETCSYLQQKGFRIIFQVEWEDRLLRIRTDYLTRIMDNITSNIIKYADPDEPVMIRSIYYGDNAGFLFENAVKQSDGNTESTCVGIRSIESMMMKMGGDARILRLESQFRIELLFPLYR